MEHTQTVPEKFCLSCPLRASAVKMLQCTALNFSSVLPLGWKVCLLTQISRGSLLLPHLEDFQTSQGFLSDSSRRAGLKVNKLQWLNVQGRTDSELHSWRCMENRKGWKWLIREGGELRLLWLKPEVLAFHVSFQDTHTCFKSTEQKPKKAVWMWMWAGSRILVNVGMLLLGTIHAPGNFW